MQLMNIISKELYKLVVLLIIPFYIAYLNFQILPHIDHFVAKGGVKVWFSWARKSKLQTLNWFLFKISQSLCQYLC